MKKWVYADFPTMRDFEGCQSGLPKEIINEINELVSNTVMGLSVSSYENFILVRDSIVKGYLLGVYMEKWEEDK